MEARMAAMMADLAADAKDRRRWSGRWSLIFISTPHFEPSNMPQKVDSAVQGHIDVARVRAGPDAAARLLAKWEMTRSVRYIHQNGVPVGCH